MKFQECFNSTVFIFNAVVSVSQYLENKLDELFELSGNREVNHKPLSAEKFQQSLLSFTSQLKVF